METKAVLISSLLMFSSMVQEFHCTNISILFITSNDNELDSTRARSAVHMAVEHVNNMTLLNNYTLQIIEQREYNTMSEPDIECNRRSALDAFYENLSRNDSNLVAVIGAGCSTATEAVAGISHYHSITMVSHSSSSGVLDNREEFPYLFRTIPSDNDIMLGIGEFIDYFNWSRVAIISQDEDQFKMVAEDLTNNLMAKNISIIRNILLSFSYPGSDNELFPPDMRIFVINADPESTVYVICQAIRDGLSRYPYVWLTQLQAWHVQQWRNITVGLSSNLNCTVEELEQFLSNQSAMTFSHYPAFVNDSLPSAGGITPDDFTAIFTTTTTTMEEEPVVEESVYFAYDAVLAIALGLKAAVNTLADSCGGTSLEDIEFSLRRGDECLGRVLKEAISNVQYNGVSGYVKFQNGSRIINNLRILQYQQSLTGSVIVQEIATVSDLNGDENKSLNFLQPVSSLWPGGIPSDGTPIVMENYPALWLIVISYAFSAAVIISAVISMVFTFVFRKRKLVRLTSPNLNQVIALGVIMFTSSVFFFSYPPSSQGVLEVFCGLRVWPVVIGISLCFMTINTKMFRIYYIFHNPSPSKRKKIFKDWHLFMLVMIFLLIDLAVLIPVSIIDSARLQPQTVEDVEHMSLVDENGITVNFVVSICESSGRVYWLTFLFGYKAVVQGIGLFLALRIRNVKIKVLNDSKEIAATIYLSSAILAVVIVVSLALSNHLTAYTASYSLGIPLSTSVVLVVVFFTKMFRLYKDPKGEYIFTQEGQMSGALSAATGALSTKDDRVYALEKQVRDLQRELQKCKTPQQATQNGHNSSSNAETDNIGHIILSDKDSDFVVKKTQKTQQNDSGVSDMVQPSQDETIPSLHTFESMELNDQRVAMDDTGLTDDTVGNDNIHVNIVAHDEMSATHSETNMST